MRRLDLAGHKFGRLTAQWPAGKSWGAVVWLCVCDCGRLSLVGVGKLRAGTTKSCGCLLAEKAANVGRTVCFKHGQHNSRTYSSWRMMIQRCTNPHNIGYRRYGGRGITVCDGWRESFVAFREDMGERPIGKTLDRINPDGNYDPTNCRWATPRDQASNKGSR